MSNIRSKFKGAKLSALKNVQKDAESNKKTFTSQDGRVGFLSVDEGKNIFRLLPPHPDDKIGSTYLPCRRAMLKCEVDLYEDGELTGKTEVKNKYVFIATQHGGLKKDPIELYIEYVRKKAEDEFSDKGDRQKFLSPVTGFRDKKGNWNWGILPSTNYVCYAIKDGVLGRLELWDSWTKEMDKLAIQEDPDDVMSVDPFSDPNEGFPLIIIKEKNDKGKVQYIISKDEPSRNRRESWEDFFERTKVTDSQLAELYNQKPLSSFYGKDVYTKRDWNYALDGLRRFDEENNYHIFDNEEFLDELNKLEDDVPEFNDINDDLNIKKIFEKGSDKEKIQQKDDFDIISIKRSLKKFISTEYGEEYLNQLPSDEKTLNKWFELYSEGDDLPLDLNKAKSVETSGSMNESDLSDEIEKLRARRRKVN